MKLIAARVQNYRSVRDTGWFDIEGGKTIIVGPNEAGKTVILQALRQINPPENIAGFNPLRDYPRAQYNVDIQSGRKDPEEILIVTAKFTLDTDDIEEIDADFKDVQYVFKRFLDNGYIHFFEGGQRNPTFTDKLYKDLRRMAIHVDKEKINRGEGDHISESQILISIIEKWTIGKTIIGIKRAVELRKWLDKNLSYVDENNTTEENRYNRLLEYTHIPERREKALRKCKERLPVFVYFNNYSRVRPNIHLERLANRLDRNILDDKQYDYGNLCLLKFLGFDVRELSELGKSEMNSDDQESFERYRESLDERQVKLNAASHRLTEEIESVWNPNTDRGETATLRVQADGQYLKVVVEDAIGVELELDQRSEGFQWLVSFFIVFFAETKDKYANAILLLDEPGLSLHGLKQREFRVTISRLAEKNQTLYTTHSPFLVGPDELPLVRVVEMSDRQAGTVVNSVVTGNDPAGLLPLQEALGYDLAQSLFVQQRNLVLEGLTDYWYFDATTKLLAESEDTKDTKLNGNIALIPAGGAGKVVYFATILHANQLKIAALLDSDNAGDNAAKQETLVHTLGNRNILRTADVCTANVRKPEIEDLLRDTLVDIAKNDFNWDIADAVMQQSTRSIIAIFKQEIGRKFSKYKLAKAFVRWTSKNSVEDLTDEERAAWRKLVQMVNRSLK